MDDKKIIITEDSLNVRPKIDLEVKDRVMDNKRNNIPNTMVYEMYQKYQNISLERDHVLTLRRGK